MNTMDNTRMKWFFEIQRFRPVKIEELEELESRCSAVTIPAGWRYHLDEERGAGFYVPSSRRIIGFNEVMDLAQPELMKAWRYISGSSRTIRTMSVGTSYTDPTRSDTDLGTLLTEKDIESWVDTEITPDSTNKSIMKAYCLWLSTEANDVLSEIGLKFDNDDLVSHSLFSKATITDITQASEGVVTTSAAHGLETGDEVHIDNVVGMTEVNDREFVITVVDSDEFSLNGEDTSGHTAYDSLGNAWLVVTKELGEIVETLYGLTLTS